MIVILLVVVCEASSFLTVPVSLTSRGHVPGKYLYVQASASFHTGLPVYRLGSKRTEVQAVLFKAVAVLSLVESVLESLKPPDIISSSTLLDFRVKYCSFSCTIS